MSVILGFQAEPRQSSFDGLTGSEPAALEQIYRDF
jgi:hypothetical protein